MNNLIKKTQQVSDFSFEVYVDSQTGETWMAQRTYAKLAGKAQSTINRRVNKVMHKGTNEEALAFTQKALGGDALLNEDTVADWIISDNPKIAKQILKAGIRLFNQQLVGYKVTSELPGEAEFKLEGFNNIRQNCLEVSKKKGYNETTGENAFNMTEGHMRDALNFNPDFTTALGATKAALVYAVATNRLHLEEDKSLQQNHQAHMMYKAGRHAIGQTYGSESIPFQAYPKVEQKLISSGTKPWVGNPSSKVKAFKGT